MCGGKQAPRIPPIGKMESDVQRSVQLCPMQTGNCPGEICKPMSEMGQEPNAQEVPHPLGFRHRPFPLSLIKTATVESSGVAQVNQQSTLTGP